VLFLAALFLSPRSGLLTAGRRAADQASQLR
jgi:hypothetical protein